MSIAAETGHLQAGPPVFTQQPAIQAVAPGQNVLLSTQISSSSPAGYQWLVNGAAMADQTNSSLELFCVSMTQSGQVFTVTATNADGPATSLPATLRVDAPGGSGLTHTWGSIPYARNNNFSPTTYRGSTGTVFFVYVDNTNMGGIWGTDIYTDDSSVASAAVHKGLLQVGERGTVRLRILSGQSQYIGSSRNGITSSSYGAWAGSYELLGLSPTITRHPADQARMVGGSAEFSVDARGTGPLHYQWYFNGVSLVGKTNSDLRVAISSTAQAGSYTVTVTDDNATITSEYGTLGVLPFAADGPQGPAFAPYSLPVGRVARMLMTGSTNGGGLWGSGFYALGSDLPRVAVHHGVLQDGETGVVAVVRLPDQPAFRSETTNGITSGPAGNGRAFALLGKVPRITKDPISQVLISAQSGQLSLEAEFSKPFDIQWRKDGTPIPGQHAASLAINAGAPGTLTLYDAVVSVPGNPNVTLPAYVFTPPATAHVYTVATPSQAAQYLSTEGNIVYVTVEGSETLGGLWGTGVYTSDSYLGRAAVHAGLLAPGETRQLAVYTLGAWPAFYSTTRNGVTSTAYGRYPGMVLSLAPSNPTQGKVALNAAGSLVIIDAAGRSCQIWASPSLLPGSWAVLDTIMAGSSAQTWIDPTKPLPDKRFYRVTLP